ncbi:MAG: ABC transporter substrate-binding protein, partial [Betaproteobacteria bacterium]
GVKRRALLVASGAWLAAAAAPSFAQPSKPVRRIAYLHPGTEDGGGAIFGAFRDELRKLGYIEGRDTSIETYWAEGKFERLASLAAEIVTRDPAVIVTSGSAGVAACKNATSSIPIVFATAAIPVEQGFVSSLRRPGGNITGVTLHLDVEAKAVEIIREALPAAKRLGFLVHEPDPFHKIMLDIVEPAARRFNFDLVVVRVVRGDDFERAFTELVARKVDALSVPNFAFLVNNRRQIIERARSARLPLFGSHYQWAEDGGVLFYGTRQEENFRRAASLVDKILRGAKPGELAVEQPERFELIVNMKTAKAIGVNLSPTTLLRATKVIE